MTRKIWWGDFAAPEFDTTDPDATIAVLPIAAVEQHGPHLPVGTDTIINTGHCIAVAALAPPDLDVRFLPVQSVGKSNEHIWAKGTLTHQATTLIDSWVELGLSVARAGVRKLVMVNSHGGNEEIMGVVGRELRVRADMLVVKTGWTRFGYPEGLISPTEQRHGIHGGEVETSLILHFRPELVDMSKADDFISVAAQDEAEFEFLRPTGTHAYSWIAKDVHPSGAIGNAGIATAEKGKLIADHQNQGFLRLLNEVRRHSLPKP
jgi:creatinine amidohydrolase